RERAFGGERRRKNVGGGHFRRVSREVAKPRFAQREHRFSVAASLGELRAREERLRGDERQALFGERGEILLGVFDTPAKDRRERGLETMELRSPAHETADAYCDRQPDGREAKHDELPHRVGRRAAFGLTSTRRIGEDDAERHERDERER